MCPLCDPQNPSLDFKYFLKIKLKYKTMTTEKICPTFVIQSVLLDNNIKS